MKNTWVLGAFYTAGTAYAQVVKDYLLKSLEAFPQIRTIIKEVSNKGTWHHNVAEKPKIILDILSELPPEQCLVFVDADAQVIQYPTLFDTISPDYDFACHYLDWNDHYGYTHDVPTKECLSGTLWMRNNQKVKELCTKWYEGAKTNNAWEQKVLSWCIEKSDVRLYNLPYEYITIPTLPDGRPHPRGIEGAVITHHQYSRIGKRRLI